jgi:hypothetical protein
VNATASLHRSLLLPAHLRAPHSILDRTTIFLNIYEPRRDSKDGSGSQLGACVPSRCNCCAAFPFAGSNDVDTAVRISTIFHAHFTPSLPDISYESPAFASGITWWPYFGICSTPTPIPTVEPWVWGTCTERRRGWRAYASPSTSNCC